METIETGKYVELVYKVTATGPDGYAFSMEFTENRPDRFVYGFEDGIVTNLENAVLNLPQGGTFDFTMSPADTEREFGKRDEDAVVALDKSVFTVDGKFDKKTVAVGRVLPMVTDDGHQIQGMVTDITGDKVVMDFNHPFAGKTVTYAGYVKTVRDSTPADMPQQGCGGCGGCGSNSGGCGDCGGCD